MKRLRKVVLQLHSRYVRGTAKGAPVQDIAVFIGYLTLLVQKEIRLPTSRVYINARVLKHNYDKRPAQHYDFMIENLHQIIKFPGKIYRNKQNKRGDYCFVKTIQNQKWLCSLELTGGKNTKRIEVVTSFCLLKENYLNDYKLLWGWRGGEPSS